MACSCYPKRTVFRKPKIGLFARRKIPPRIRAKSADLLRQKIFRRTPLNFRRTSAGIFGQKSGYRLSLPLAALSRSINDLELDLIVALSPILECLKLCSRVHRAVKTLKTDPMKQTKYISILSCLNNQSLCAAI